MKKFVFDIDGTIAFNGRPVAQEICLEIEKISEVAEVIFASARPIRDILPMISERLKSCTLIGCNGAMAYREGEWLKKDIIDDHSVGKIIDRMKKLKIPYLLDGKWGFSVSEVQHEFHEYINSLSSEISDEDSIRREGVVKILVLDSALDPDIEKISSINKLSINFHKRDSFFDITSSDCDKKKALNEIGVDMKICTAFGNDSNDFDMLESAGKSVFVGRQEDFSKADCYISENEVSTMIRRLSPRREIVID